MSITKKNHSLENSFSKNNDKDNLNNFLISQEQNIFRYLQNHTIIASMVSKATGIPQKCICCYKRDLEKNGLLYEVKRKLCKLTGFKAWYLSTNPDLLQKSNLKKLGYE